MAADTEPWPAGSHDGADAAKTSAPACPVVGIGASAGGLEAFRTFFAHTPSDSGLAFVLVQHLARDRESMLAELLGRCTQMPVANAQDGQRVEPDRVYVIPHDASLTIEGGRLSVARQENATLHNPIDTFFVSLAQDLGERAACIVLSGSGHDGTLGLRAVKEQGGLALAQNLAGAAHESMLRSAVQTGLVDLQLPVEEMPGRLAEYFRHLDDMAKARGPDGLQEARSSELQQICGLLHAATGHDFSDYKDRTLIRRIQRRMQVLQIGEVAGYVEELHKSRGEVELLFKDLLIGVTHFFRDPDAFGALEGQVIPELFDGKTLNDQVRVWVPGCATGEEAYSIAMLLREHAAHLDQAPEIQVFASDIDEQALQIARAGRYPALIERDLAPERLESFLIKEDGTYRVRGSLRERCTFAQHNLLRDPPFSRIDLISCRNLMIYMNASLQRRLIPILHYALAPSGWLFLGPSENITRHGELFATVDKKRRIFRRREHPAAGPPSFPIAAAREPGAGPRQARPSHPPPGDRLAARTDRVLERYAPAYVVINEQYEIVRSSTRTGTYLELGGGKPELNILVMARQDLRLDLRTALHAAVRRGEKVVKSRVPMSLDGEDRVVTITVEALPGGQEDGRHFVVLFQEEAPQRQPATEREVEGSRSERETIAALEHELQGSREHLQAVTEELETSNEELKSSNEELSSVNEELQSTNEELQTSQEELKSINEELHTINGELSDRVEQLSCANSDLKNLLENTGIPILFLDSQLRIRTFTPTARDLFNLRQADQGRPITEITGTLEYEGLEDDIRHVVRAQDSLVREVDASQGRSYLMRVLPYRTTEDLIEGIVVTFTEITERKAAEQRQKMLVAELSHRVKNMLATVQAIAMQTLKSAPSLEAFRDAFLGRLTALSGAHTLLTNSDWQGAQLHDLLTEVLDAYQTSDGDRIRIRGDDLDLTPRAALTLSLVINELATNAAKYGALSSPSGTVDVESRRAEPGRAVSIGWRESGGPRIDGPVEPAFGLSLIERSMSYELNGECRLEFQPEGLYAELVIPDAPGNVRPA